MTVVSIGLEERLETEAAKAGQRGKSLEDVVGEHMLQARKEMERAVAVLGGDVAVELDVLAGDPAEVIGDFSGHVDVLVSGSRGYGPLRGVVLGASRGASPQRRAAR